MLFFYDVQSPDIEQGAANPETLPLLELFLVLDPLVAVYSVLCYYLLLVLWGKINYRFTLEWFLIYIQGLVSGQRSERLNVERMLHRVEWKNFKLD